MISPAPAMRTREAMARSAAVSSQSSMARMKRTRAWAAVGSWASFTGGITQLPSRALRAWEFLKLSRDQNSGSQRSRSPAAKAARWAELMTRTAWNLKPTGLG